MCVSVMRALALLCASAAAALVALAALAAANDDVGNLAESEFMSPMPFVMGPRYGRSPPRHITIRNDKFFLSRYGKRSQPPPAGAPRPLLCAPLGGYALYRCAPAPAPSTPLDDYHHDRRSKESREVGEDE